VKFDCDVASRATSEVRLILTGIDASRRHASFINIYSANRRAARRFQKQQRFRSSAAGVSLCRDKSAFFKDKKSAPFGTLAKSARADEEIVEGRDDARP
jgi:hypothetical protein